MKKTLLLLSFCAAVAACQQQPAPEPEEQVKLETEEQKTAYALGVSNGENMARSLEQIEELGIVLDQALVIRGLQDALSGDLELDQEERQKVLFAFGQKAQQLQTEKQERDLVTNKADGEAFLAENAKQDGVTVLDSGLQYKVLEAGDAASGKPSADDMVVVHYAGTLIDGTEFDSSYQRGEPAEFGVSQVISGWTEALQLMNKGAKWQLFIPSDLAYGERGSREIPANSVLLFNVELLDIKPSG